MTSYRSAICMSGSRSKNQRAASPGPPGTQIPALIDIRAASCSGARSLQVAECFQLLDAAITELNLTAPTDHLIGLIALPLGKPFPEIPNNARKRLPRPESATWYKLGNVTFNNTGHLAIRPVSRVLLAMSYSATTVPGSDLTPCPEPAERMDVGSIAHFGPTTV